MSKTKPASFSPYFTEADAEQIRAAFLAAGAAEGYASVSELIEAATLREIKRLQRRHNTGKPWDGIPAGGLRRGQRTRNETSLRANPARKPWKDTTN